MHHKQNLCVLRSYELLTGSCLPTSYNAASITVGEHLAEIWTFVVEVAFIAAWAWKALADGRPRAMTDMGLHEMGGGLLTGCLAVPRSDMKADETAPHVVGKRQISLSDKRRIRETCIPPSVRFSSRPSTCTTTMYNTSADPPSPDTNLAAG